MNLKKLTAVLILLLSPGLAQSEAPWKVSAGVGMDFGVLPGLQVSRVRGNNKVNFGTNLVGATLGYEYLLTPKHTLGFGVHEIFFFRAVGGSVSYHYYHSGVNNRGFSLGLNVGYFQARGFTSSVTNERTFILPSIGFQF